MYMTVNSDLKSLYWYLAFNKLFSLKNLIDIKANFLKRQSCPIRPTSSRYNHVAAKVFFSCFFYDRLEIGKSLIKNRNKYLI